MRRQRGAKGPVPILAWLILTAGCATKDPGDEIFVPDLSQLWLNQADSNDSFNFNPDETGVSASAFTGIENNGSSLCFAGSFTNRSISFTYDANAGAKAGQRIAGTIVGESTGMMLKGPGGTLVLAK